MGLISMLILIFTTQSTASAYTDIVKECHNREMHGCFELGKHFQLRTEYQKAMRYYQMACDNGYDDGCLKLGVMYHYGKGVKRNLSKASKYYASVCSHGNGSGCTYMGILEMSRKNGKTAKALEYFDSACKKGDASGCQEYAYYHKENYGHKDLAAAISSYEKACKLDRKECLALGMAYDNGELGLVKNAVKARSYYERACKGESYRACYKLGNLYYKGRGTQKSYAKAKHYYELSCKSDMLQDGSEKGCNNLAILYQYGRGVKKDRKMAEKYYRKACKKGYSKACQH